jgi:hypothetical protein
MRSLSKAAVATAVTGAAVLVGAQVPAVAAAPTPHPAIAPAGQRGADRLTPRSSADVCVFETNGDYVHVSSSAFEASGHGWWTNGDCPTSTAVVTVQLQEYYSDGSWHNKGTVGRSTVRSGGGAGNRATGRAGCNNAKTVSWRSVVDVDLVGLADDPGKLVTPVRDIGCLRS